MLKTWSLLLLFFKCYSLIFVCAGSLLSEGFFFLVVASGGFSLVAVCELLIVVASFVAEQRLLNLQASVELGLNSFGTWA